MGRSSIATYEQKVKIEILGNLQLNTIQITAALSVVCRILFATSYATKNVPLNGIERQVQSQSAKSLQ